MLACATFWPMGLGRGLGPWKDLPLPPPLKFDKFSWTVR